MDNPSWSGAADVGFEVAGVCIAGVSGGQLRGAKKAAVEGASYIDEAVEANRARKAVKAVSKADEITKAGKTVLGHQVDNYAGVAEKIGARYFKIDNKYWTWEANQKFLNRIIKRGDEVILTRPIKQVMPNSTLQKEINYLLEKGYKASEDGLKLIPSGN